MAIIARHIEGVSAVAVASGQRLALPEPRAVFALFPGEASKGARLLDDTALKIRTFTLPAVNLQIICEPSRIRFDMLKPHAPEEMRLGEIVGATTEALYQGVIFPRFGFNYDITFQYDTVIPQRELWKAFLKGELLEQMTHFGWQVTFQKEKGKRRDTCFFKVISPLELRVMTNVEVDRELPSSINTQKLFEQWYTETQEIVKGVTFS